MTQSSSPTFARRTFTLPLLARSAAAALKSSPTLLKALRQPATSPALREKVMLAVTAVNDCRYCSWVHTGLALQNDVDLDDLQHVLDAGTFGQLDEREAVAILYGKHFADTVREPDAEAERALARAWSPEERAEIMAYIHAIYFANLAGNSADAWLARLRGAQVEGGNPLAEAVAAVVAAPVLGGIAIASRRSHRQMVAL
ncbi:MAG: carboxymuconolactone decarboxylase family protein [Gammaproteobacteria bacterium]